jgi:hypothetical protein
LWILLQHLVPLQKNQSPLLSLSIQAS